MLPPVEAAITAGKVDERLAVRDFGSDHLADEDIVIPGSDAMVGGTLDGCQHARNEGHAGRSAFPRNAVAAVLALACEAFGEVPLVFGQHVDSKVGCRAEVVDYRDRVAEANQDQRRLQRHRSEGAYREPMRG